ncbi:hypothetical protein PENSTE_c006G09094 [Penicillium steckii]|uniref:Uncharacterized protein n=1 Tax=Penicillium steckii TaxID=303698 RepID=A0A1V6TIA5_9EURO|nr:hypothetical protein PENSTE_c006G09094 [Penicillium steckii]
MDTRLSPGSRPQLHWHRSRLPKTPCASPPVTPPLNRSLNIQAAPNSPPPVYTPSSHPPGYGDIHLTPLASIRSSNRPSASPSPSPSTVAASRLSLATTSHTATPSETSIHSCNATTGDESLRQAGDVVGVQPKECLASWSETLLRKLHRLRWWILVTVFLALFIVAMVWWIVSSSIGVTYHASAV